MKQERISERIWELFCATGLPEAFSLYHRVKAAEQEEETAEKTA